MSMPFPVSRQDTIDPAGLAVGDQLPPLVVPITTTLIVTGAIASRDFFPGHHDAAAARAAGQPDVFMNIMTTSGLLGRFLTDWAGPGAVLVSLNLSLGAANLPGDTMTISGEITAIEVEPATALLAVTITGHNERGRHAAADARLQLPRLGAAATSR
jgi:acyl dehydratase